MSVKFHLNVFRRAIVNGRAERANIGILRRCFEGARGRGGERAIHMGGFGSRCSG
jgi:hypothetical protein